MIEVSPPVCSLPTREGVQGPSFSCPRATILRCAGVCITRGPVCLLWSFAVLHPVLFPVCTWFSSAINTRLLVLLAFREGRGYGSNCSKAKKYLHLRVRHKFTWKCISRSPSLRTFFLRSSVSSKALSSLVNVQALLHLVLHQDILKS